MKILCLLLSFVVALLAGVLVFTAQSGHLPMVAPAKVSQTEEDAKAAEPPIPLFGPQVGLVDELVESLRAGKEELAAAKLRLDKREKNLQELYATYLKLQKETGALIDELETRLVKVDGIEMQNFKKLAGVYSKMDPSSAAQSLKHMEADRVSLILSQMDSRAMAAIMNEAVSAASDGSEYVAEWSDAIRRLNAEKEQKQ